MFHTGAKIYLSEKNILGFGVRCTLKLLIFFENFYGARYFFSCHLPSKFDIYISACALRHLQVHVYSWISV